MAFSSSISFLSSSSSSFLFECFPNASSAEKSENDRVDDCKKRLETFLLESCQEGDSIIPFSKEVIQFGIGTTPQIEITPEAFFEKLGAKDIGLFTSKDITFIMRDIILKYGLAKLSLYDFLGFHSYRLLKQFKPFLSKEEWISLCNEWRSIYFTTHLGLLRNDPGYIDTRWPIGPQAQKVFRSGPHSYEMMRAFSEKLKNAKIMYPEEGLSKNKKKKIHSSKETLFKKWEENQDVLRKFLVHEGAFKIFCKEIIDFDLPDSASSLSRDEVLSNIQDYLEMADISSDKKFSYSFLEMKIIKLMELCDKYWEEVELNPELIGSHARLVEKISPRGFLERSDQIQHLLLVLKEVEALTSIEGLVSLDPIAEALEIVEGDLLAEIKKRGGKNEPLHIGVVKHDIEVFLHREIYGICFKSHIRKVEKNLTFLICDLLCDEIRESSKFSSRLSRNLKHLTRLSEVTRFVDFFHLRDADPEMKSIRDEFMSFLSSEEARISQERCTGNIHRIFSTFYYSRGIENHFFLPIYGFLEKMNKRLLEKGARDLSNQKSLKNQDEYLFWLSRILVLHNDVSILLGKKPLNSPDEDIFTDEILDLLDSCNLDRNPANQQIRTLISEEESLSSEFDLPLDSDLEDMAFIEDEEVLLSSLKPQIQTFGKQEESLVSDFELPLYARTEVPVKEGVFLSSKMALPLEEEIESSLLQEPQLKEEKIESQEILKAPLEQPKKREKKEEARSKMSKLAKDVDVLSKKDQSPLQRTASSQSIREIPPLTRKEEKLRAQEEELLSKKILKTRKLKKILNAMGLKEKGGTRHDRMSHENGLSRTGSSYGTTFIPRHGAVPMGTAQAIRNQVLTNREAVQSEPARSRSKEPSSSHSESSKQGARKSKK